MKNKILVSALVATLLSVSLLPSAFADTTTTATLSGSVTVSGSGDWNSGIGMTGTVSPTAASTAIWTGQAANGATDYITFTDANAASDGAYLSMKAANASFSYSGSGTGNTGLVYGTNVWMSADGGTTPSVPTLGLDNTAKSANIISASSCSGSATSTKYLFHTNLRSASQGYKLRLGTNNKTVFRVLPTSECTATVKLAFDQVFVTYAALTTGGTYTNTLTVTATDGTI